MRSDGVSSLCELVDTSCVTMLGFLFFFFNDTATTEIYTLSLHDALPISDRKFLFEFLAIFRLNDGVFLFAPHQELLAFGGENRSEEHTSELQSRLHLVCRLLLEKKKRPRSPPDRPRPSIVALPTRALPAR